tara:strand:+ start:732 stop:1466 length:735 start_codon:yes stop_codon:yes gene_type:complete
MKRILKKEKELSYFATIEGVKFYDANCEWTWTKSRKKNQQDTMWWGNTPKEKQKQVKEKFASIYKISKSGDMIRVNGKGATHQGKNSNGVFNYKVCNISKNEFVNVCSDASIKPKRCAVAIHRVVASTFLHHGQNENNLEVMARLDVDHRVRRNDWAEADKQKGLHYHLENIQWLLTEFHQKKTASENSNRQTKNTYSPIRNQNLQDFLEQQQMIFKLDKILTKTEMLNFAERANKQILELNNK